MKTLLQIFVEILEGFGPSGEPETFKKTKKKRNPKVRYAWDNAYKTK